MSPPKVLAFAGIQHDLVRSHLFPGDGLEAAAVLLCSRSGGPRVRLLVRDMILVPHNACRERRRDFVSWPGTYVEDAIERAEAEDLTLVLVHSHPGGQFAFSELDDRSCCRCTRRSHRALSPHAPCGRRDCTGNQPSCRRTCRP